MRYDNVNLNGAKFWFARPSFSRSGIVLIIFTLPARVDRTRVIQVSHFLTNALGEVLFDGPLDALGVFDTESGDDGGVRTTFMGPAKNPQ